MTGWSNALRHQENQTKGMCKEYNIPYSIIRPSAVYGPTDMTLRVSQYFIEKAFLYDSFSLQDIKEMSKTYLHKFAN